MAKPAHTRLTYSGVVGTSSAALEHWSFSLNFPASVLPPETEDAAADALANQARFAYADQLADTMPLDIVLTETRIAAIGADGLTVRRGDGSYVQGINVGPAGGAMAKQPAPLQQALCVSLQTSRAGATGKGRFFLPWPALSLDADDKRIPVAQVEGFIDDVGAWLSALQTNLGGQLQVVSSKGYMTEVGLIKIGRVPDTMRSRREDLVEGYVTLPLA